MMKACAETTRPHGIKTTVSLNPVMVDGTGMCGGCRVKLHDGMKFACVDGPDFDGHAGRFRRPDQPPASFREGRETGRRRVDESCRARLADPAADPARVTAP
jgi:sulfide dehydrogenase subunit beta